MTDLEKNFLQDLLSFIIHKDLYDEYTTYSNHYKSTEMRELIEKEFCKANESIK